MKEEYISMDIFPGLKIHYLLQIVETGIRMHGRHMIWGRICYSMVMAMVLKKKKKLGSQVSTKTLKIQMLLF